MMNINPNPNHNNDNNHNNKNKNKNNKESTIVPQLSKYQITFHELQITTKVLNALSTELKLLDKQEKKKKEKECRNSNSNRKKNKDKKNNKKQYPVNQDQIIINHDTTFTTTTSSSSSSPNESNTTNNNERQIKRPKLLINDSIMTSTTNAKNTNNNTTNNKDNHNHHHNNNSSSSNTNDNDNQNHHTTTTTTLDLYKHSNFRPLRKALHPIFIIHQRQFQSTIINDNHNHNHNPNNNNNNHNNNNEQQITKQYIQNQKRLITEIQQRYINKTNLRKGRIDKLNQLKNEYQKEEEDKIKQVIIMEEEEQEQEQEEKYNMNHPNNHHCSSSITGNSRQEEMRKLMIPDGHVDTTSTTINTVSSLSSTAATTTTATTTTASATNTTALDETINDINNNSNNNDQQQQQQPTILLPKLQSCYVCKIRYRQLHFFYNALCPSCATHNYTKRHQTTNLSNKVAIVTGSRVKIGYQTVLKLLRSNCTVIATTRFPNIAVDTYRKEYDFNEWKDRLYVYGLDLRDVIGLELFIQFVKMKFGHVGIDILINNACQTVRRPTGYYKPLVEKERELWGKGDSIHRGLLKGCLEFETMRRRLVLEQKQEGFVGVMNDQHQQVGQHHTTSLIGDESTFCSSNKMDSDRKDDEKLYPETSSSTMMSSLDTTANTIQSPISSSLTPSDSVTITDTSTSTVQPPFEKTGISHSAAMSQMVLLPDDNIPDSSNILPPGLSDINGHQLDLRKTNSWLLKLDQVSTPEIIECMFINAIAPFVLNSRLQSLMKTIPNGSKDEKDRPDRYIINVSAMEGKFYRYKMPNHPHTNMAKASLNMMTRTSAEDLAKNHRIFMNSVDTGWINDENPLERASRTAKNNNFQTPIDEIDAAARILDPIFVGVAMDLEVKAKECEDNDSGNYDEGSGESNINDKDNKRKKWKKKEDKKILKEYGKFFKDYKETEW